MMKIVNVKLAVKRILGVECGLALFAFRFRHVFFGIEYSNVEIQPKLINLRLTLVKPKFIKFWVGLSDREETKNAHNGRFSAISMVANMVDNQCQ
jgi:hypothetical protein